MNRVNLGVVAGLLLAGVSMTRSADAAEKLTAERVGQRAAQTSYSAKAGEENLRAAAARVDQAWAAFLPTLTGTARYTRLSPLTNPPFGGSTTIVAAPTPAPGTPEGTPLNPNQLFPIPPSALSFPVFVDQYLLQGSIIVPISDYFFRINQRYSSAARGEDAARHDLLTVRAKALSDGKQMFYAWIRARRTVKVAEQALEEQKTHLKDVNNQYTVGNVSKTDVLRVETAVASAELAVERAKNLAIVAEKQVRIAMHAKDEETFEPDDNLEGVPPAVQGDLARFSQEAYTARPEFKSIEASAEALRKQATVARNGYLPQVVGSANAYYANPNPRIFPQTQEFRATWDVGAQLTWTPNDILSAGGAGRELDARAVAAEAQKELIRDGIRLEVTEAFQAVRVADVAIESTKRAVASATEAHRVARELFAAGKITSVLLTDAEAELVRARLEALNAIVDARVARVRLDHALGRDVKQN